MYLLIGALHAIPVVIVGHYSCNRFAILGVALLSAALGFATGNPAYIGIDLVCVIGATIAVLGGTAYERKVATDQKRAARQAREAAKQAERAAKSRINDDKVSGAILACGACLVILVALLASDRRVQSVTAETVTPPEQSGSHTAFPSRTVATEAAAEPSPPLTAHTTAQTHQTEDGAEDEWTRILAEEDADRKRRYDELDRFLPPSFERTMAECSGRSDEIEAWVCRDRFLDRLRKHGIPSSQAALDGLLWTDPAQYTASEPIRAPTPIGATPDSRSTSFFMTPDTRRTRHTGQRVGEAPRAITDPKDCLRIPDNNVVAACLKHFP
jgi:hypothetical protein